MPELAEVEFNRKQWDPGLRQKVVRVRVHAGKRIFRGTDAAALRQGLAGAVLVGSEARGKRMLFRFSGGRWLGLHLGMTGRLRVEKPDFTAGRHDHLALVQARQALVFRDPRQFGRIQYHAGQGAPEWWKQLPPAVTGPKFTPATMLAFLRRHARLPLKATLLLQEGFPGIGNWMADEVLWRAGLHPRLPAGSLGGGKLRELWREVRWVSRRALETIGEDYSDPPRGWLLHERWSRDGVCPRHGGKLERGVVGGRTTAWCAQCQGNAPRADKRKRKPHSPRPG